MSKTKNNKTLKIVVVVLLIITIPILIYITYNSIKYTYLTGTVTKYSNEMAMDGGISIYIDGKFVLVSNGPDMRPTLEYDATPKSGKVIGSPKKGDKVQAKLISSNGHLTIIGCPECYIKKID